MYDCMDVASSLPCLCGCVVFASPSVVWLVLHKAAALCRVHALLVGWCDNNTCVCVCVMMCESTAGRAARTPHPSRGRQPLGGLLKSVLPLPVHTVSTTFLWCLLVIRSHVSALLLWSHFVALCAMLHCSTCGGGVVCCCSCLPGRLLPSCCPLFRLVVWLFGGWLFITSVV